MNKSLVAEIAIYRIWLLCASPFHHVFKVIQPLCCACEQRRWCSASMNVSWRMATRLTTVVNHYVQTCVQAAQLSSDWQQLRITLLCLLRAQIRVHMEVVRLANCTHPFMACPDCMAQSTSSVQAWVCHVARKHMKSCMLTLQSEISAAKDGKCISEPQYIWNINGIAAAALSRVTCNCYVSEWLWLWSWQLAWFRPTSAFCSYFELICRFSSCIT